MYTISIEKFLNSVLSSNLFKLFASMSSANNYRHWLLPKWRKLLCIFRSFEKLDEFLRKQRFKDHFLNPKYQYFELHTHLRKIFSEPELVWSKQLELVILKAFGAFHKCKHTLHIVFFRYLKN